MRRGKKMPNIIGIGGSIHDFSSCIITNERKIFAIEDERITRERFAINAKKPCYQSFQYCLNCANITLDDVDVVAANDALKPLIDNTLFPNIKYYNHHLTHAYSVFFSSCFKSAAILVVDGAGSEFLSSNKQYTNETVTFAYGDCNKIEIIDNIKGTLHGNNPISRSETLMSNSLGEFYRCVSQAIGLNWLSGPGKMMGMVSYGAEKDEIYKYLKRELKKNVKLLPKGKVLIDINGENGLIERLFNITNNGFNGHGKFFFHSKLANAAQSILEDLLIHLLDHLFFITKSKNICIVGGVALNSLALGKILRKTKFDKIHAFFAPGDNGTAIGAAIKEYIDISSHTDEECRFNISPYLGRTYNKSDIYYLLSSSNINYKEILGDDIYVIVANLISNGNVIAWFQGSSEFGPRALGNRSILADPRNPHIRDYINSIIKHREWFRPFAAAIIESDANEYFKVDCISPWMQFVFVARKKYYETLPAVTHIDGTARIQTVKKNDNEKFYRLLEAFKNITDIPILLNTSFNIKGEPIVESPSDAITTFISSKIDVLVIDNFLITKKCF